MILVMSDRDGKCRPIHNIVFPIIAAGARVAHDCLYSTDRIEISIDFHGIRYVSCMFISIVALIYLPKIKKKRIKFSLMKRTSNM